MAVGLACAVALAARVGGAAAAGCPGVAPVLPGAPEEAPGAPLRAPGAWLRWGHPREEDFRRFAEERGRRFASQDEYDTRLFAFARNLDRVDELNAAPHGHGHTATYGVNDFADWFPHEIESLFGRKFGRRPAPPPRPSGLGAGVGANCTQAVGCCGNCVANNSGIARKKLPDPPASFDWREHKSSIGVPVVTPIVNQGKCGSCWAFSAVAAVETAWLLAGKPPVGGGSGALSVQRVLDCVYPMLKGGAYPQSPPNCSGGGLVVEGLEYGLNYGVPSASADGYQCEKGCADGSISCKHPYPTPRPTSPAPAPGNSVAWITQCCGQESDFTCGDGSPNERAIKRALTTYGLLAINVNARNWVGYTSGIIRNHCDPIAMNHAVILAGYGTDIVDGEPVDYWLIRNSWGTQWGEQGYGRLFRDNATNVCGFATEMWAASASTTEARDGPMYIDECGQ